VLGADVGTCPGDAAAGAVAVAVGNALAPVVAEAGAEPAAGVGAGAAISGFGKKVAFFPLCSCHWSQSRTREKPKITQRMVRRISFMGSSLTK
jgi:hypothetical protein